MPPRVVWFLFQVRFMKMSIQMLVVIAALGAWGASEPRAPDALHSGALALPSSDTNFLSLDHVLREVLLSNPSLKAAQANWEAMKQRVPQARAWEDLRGGFDTVVGRFVDISRNSFTDQKLMLEQTVPVTGKNRLRGEAAEAEAIAAFQDMKRRQLDLRAKARMAFYQLANANEQIRIIYSNLELLRQFVRISRSKYAAGTK